jgi:hypothetical protein
MNRSHDLDWFGLERLYDEGRRLFLRGRYDKAVDRFKRIYEDTLDLRDVTEIVDDFYDLPRDAWLIKYQARFKT